MQKWQIKQNRRVGNRWTGSGKQDRKRKTKGQTKRARQSRRRPNETEEADTTSHRRKKERQRKNNVSGRENGNSAQKAAPSNNWSNGEFVCLLEF